MILISSHIDRVITDYKLSFKQGMHTGLLDNTMGMLLTYLTLYSDENLLRLENEGKLRIFHGRSEEWGELRNAPRLTKKDIALVVDVVIPEKADLKYDFILDNIGGYSKKRVSEIKELLEWEGFKVKTKLYDGNPDDEDESWQWRKKGIRGMGFMIPIQGANDGTGWHSIHQNNHVSSNKMLICQQGLKRLICALME